MYNQQRNTPILTHEQENNTFLTTTKIKIHLILQRHNTIMSYIKGTFITTQDY